MMSGKLQDELPNERLDDLAGELRDDLPDEICLAICEIAGQISSKT